VARPASADGPACASPCSTDDGGDNDAPATRLEARAPLELELPETEVLAEMWARSMRSYESRKWRQRVGKMRLAARRERIHMVIPEASPNSESRFPSFKSEAAMQAAASPRTPKYSCWCPTLEEDEGGPTDAAC